MMGKEKGNKREREREVKRDGKFMDRVKREKGGGDGFFLRK